MKISQHWLQDFVDLPADVSPKALKDTLTLHSFEVDSIEAQGAHLDGIVLGKLVKIEKHSQADRLTVCTVDIGTEKLQIVCGGSNLQHGMKVAVARVGSWVRWHGEGEPVELKETDIRGVRSYGMICAANEIGMATGKEAEREIVDVSPVDAPLGTPLAKALGVDDVILEIDNKAITNRPDCWGHYGVAREIAAIFDRKLKPFAPKKFESKKKEYTLSVKIDSPVCRRNCNIVVAGVHVGPSPEWMRKRLQAIGVKSINTVVDVTNYVLWELGQPMHAFDLHKLTEPKLLIRQAYVGEKITTLDGREHTLTPEMCIIADSKQPLDIAGVMGGAASMINENTTVILLEAANFDPVAIRKTAQALELRTDSSVHFEKSLDPTMPPVAIARAIELLQQCMPGAYVASVFSDEGTAWKKILFTKTIELDISFLYRKIGAHIPVARIGSILKSLGFSFKKKKKSSAAGKHDVFVVTVPTWRATKDIATQEDLIEEVARMYGYNAIPEHLPSMSIAPPPRNDERLAMRSTRMVLAQRFGFMETQTYSFLSLDTMQKMDLDPAEHIAIANPLSSDQTHLRRRLLPNLLIQVSKNMRENDAVKMFEVGKVFLQDTPGVPTRLHSGEFLPAQPVRVTGVVSAKGNETPFFAAKEAGIAVLEELGISYRLQSHEHLTNWMHPGRVATIFVGDEEVGDISELHPAYAHRFGLACRAGFFSLDLSALVPHMQPKSAYKPLSVFPSVKRDIAFVVREHVRFEHIMEYLMGADPLLVSAEVFDMYRGKNVGEHKKSLAFHLIFSHPERTLTAQEVETISTKIEKGLHERFHAEVRS